ncbi:helix-turn-helix domain-containing protein [Streptomyces sp. BBFR51]|uniref:helix-turn-helix domain-containing protein n=1 Tax=Streptomyces sp. BBFR51 TaxID=3372856 RepID=UPI0037DCBD36
MTPERGKLGAALRELRMRTGLSLAALAERTTFSKSSWERYLNGKTVPPRRAVQDLCRLAREPEGRLLALWEIAESESSGRAAETAPDPSDPRPSRADGGGTGTGTGPGEGRGRGRGRLVAVLAVVGAVTVGGVVSGILLLPHRQDGAGPQSGAASASGPGPRCRGTACEGQDPMQMYCGAGPDTLTAERTTTGARVEVRYSRGCGASWARMWGTRVGDRLEMTAGGPIRRARIADEVDAENYVYTVMTAARPGAVVRACFRPASADGERECVDARVGGAAGASRSPSPQ